MMAFGSRLVSKFRSKKGKIGGKDGKDGDQTGSHNIPSSSNSQPTTLPPPAVVETGQNPTAASAQAHPISVDEARDELTVFLRGKYPILDSPRELVKVQSLIYYRGSIFSSA